MTLTFTRTLSLCSLALLLVAAVPVRANPGDAPAAFDGSVPYVANVERIRFPDAVITSETYVRFRENGSADAPGDVEKEYVDIHQVAVPQGVSGERRVALQRVAIEGIISSYSDSNERLDRDALARTLATRLPLVDGRHHIGGIITSEEMSQRFGINGVVSSEDDVIQLAFLRREAEPVIATDAEFETAVATDINAAQPVRNAERRSLWRLLRPAMGSYLRSDEIQFDSGETETTVVAVVVPRFDVAFQQDRWAVRGHYEAEFGDYVRADRDSFVNHEFVGNYRYSLSSMNQVNVAGIYRNWTDKRSFQAVEDFNALLLGTYTYESLSGDLLWEYGTEETRYRSLTNFTAEESEASGNDTGYQLTRNRLGWTGFYRVSKRLTWLIDGAYQDFDYVEREDSREAQLGPGVEWWPSRRLKSRLVVGYGRKQHPADGEWISEPLWNGEVSWRPRRKTTLGFSTRREFLEVFERDGELFNGEFGVQQYATVTWLQKWAPLWQSELSVTFQQRKFDEDFREDDALQLIFRGDYRVTPRLTLGTDGVYTRQESQASEDYQRWTLTIRADLRL